MEVSKRDGTLVSFDPARIENALSKAFKNTGEVEDSFILAESSFLQQCVRNQLVGNTVSVEEIQDRIEELLMNKGYYQTAKAYILYRSKHQEIRKLERGEIDGIKLMSSYIDASDWRVKENSTVTHNLGGLILSNSGAVTANYWLEHIYDEEVAEAHRSAAMHIHDLSMLAGYCAGWSLKQIIQEGLGGVSGRITSSPARHLSTLCNQMVNFLGIMQNEWAGAQALSSFDTYLAPFVKIDNLTYKQTKQCIQSFIYGVNTPSRWGCVPTTTEVLSSNGFRRYDELKEGDLIYTWHEGNLELNPVRKVVIKPFEGQLHQYIGRDYNQTVTPEHRVLYKVFNSEEYRIDHSSELFSKGTPPDLPTKFMSADLPTAALSDEEIVMAAILYTDSSIYELNGHLRRITITKSKNREGGSLIESTARALGLKYSKRDSKSPRAFAETTQYVFYGEEARTLKRLIGGRKAIAPIFESMDARQSKLFLDTWLSFDGVQYKGRLQFDNEDIGRSLQHIGLRAGFTSYICSYQGSNKKPTNYIKFRSGYTKRVTDRKYIPYSGLVWCPNVENGTAVFRAEDGNLFISGQCQSPFTNITLDWTVPEDLSELNCLVGGRELDFCYKDCQEEMNMVNKAFIEVMLEGDANGRGFQYPIPTYSITKDFDWGNSENNRLLFEMTAKYGTPYFSNYLNSDMKPSDVRSMCCRLRLDLRELRKKSGGYFGSGESTGSVGVVTLNLPRLGYLSKNREDFYHKLDKLMDIAARSLDTKRRVITGLLKDDMYPYTKHYLGDFHNHFSTIGLVGMNECIRNISWIYATNIAEDEGRLFAEAVLNHMRERLSDYQEQYGDLFNLEATPAESTSYRLAKHDREQFPNIEAAGTESAPYYTNSSQLPVNYTTDVFEALDHQDSLQILYTSGTVFHAFLGERLPDWRSAANLVKKIAEGYKLPYYTLSPTYSVCKEHGYIPGEVYTCPYCGKVTEVYSRITGYYRPVSNWNKGKEQEFKERSTYDVDSLPLQKGSIKLKEEAGDTKETTKGLSTITLFKTSTCPNCKTAKVMLDSSGIPYDEIYADKQPELAKKFNIMSAPTLIVPNDTGYDRLVGVGQIKGYIASR